MVPSFYPDFRVKLQKRSCHVLCTCGHKQLANIKLCLRATIANLDTSRCLATHGTPLQLYLSFLVLLSTSKSLLASTLGRCGLDALVWIATEASSRTKYDCKHHSSRPLIAPKRLPMTRLNLLSMTFQHIAKGVFIIGVSSSKPCKASR